MRAAIYCRSATSDEERITHKITRCQAYCLERGYDVVGVYRDNGWSGLCRNRPGLDRLIEDSQQGKFDIVVSPDATDLSRASSTFQAILQQLQLSGVWVEYTSHPNVSQQAPNTRLMEWATEAGAGGRQQAVRGVRPLQ